MASKRVRVPMFWKFLAGTTVLSLLLIVGGAIKVHRETRMVSRGNYLTKHFNRYLAYQRGLGAGVSGAADLVASDAALRAALARLAASGAAADSAAGGEVGAVATRHFEAMSGKNGIRPDLFLIFEPANRLVWANPGSILGQADLRELEPVARVRAGASFFNQVLVYGGHAVQLAGLPIRAPGSDAIVGGLLIGVDVERYMRQYQEQSDDRADMQHRLTLVHDGEVVASVFPREEWASLATALSEDSWVKASEGDQLRDVIITDAGYWDFDRRTLEGFTELRAGEIGTMVLMRSRANLVGRQAIIPWTEAAIGLVLALIVASLLAMWITRPIKRFVDQSQQMLQGELDLNHRIEIGSRDEVSDLADNINTVFQRLFALASEVQGAAFHVGASSAEISAASKQMLTGLKDQTMKIEGSTAAVTELSASIQQVASNAVESSKAAEKSNLAVTSAVERMQEIRGAVEEAAAKMHELGESGKRIGNIVEVIRQISEQTSLLALNASIEAAHAGEQGRGFAVVADEVSSLARRVGQSAKDIETLIQTIKEQTTEAVRSMQVGSDKVETGTRLVTDTLQDLKQLIAVINDTASAVQEQAVVSDEIARNMDSVQKIAAEMLAGSEEAVAQGEQLHELAFNLEQSVGGFNLEGGQRRGAPALKPRGGAG